MNEWIVMPQFFTYMRMKSVLIDSSMSVKLQIEVFKLNLLLGALVFQWNTLNSFKCSIKNQKNAWISSELSKLTKISTRLVSSELIMEIVVCYPTFIHKKTENSTKTVNIHSVNPFVIFSSQKKLLPFNCKHFTDPKTFDIQFATNQS